MFKMIDNTSLCCYFDIVGSSSRRESVGWFRIANFTLSGIFIQLLNNCLISAPNRGRLSRDKNVRNGITRLSMQYLHVKNDVIETDSGVFVHQICFLKSSRQDFGCRP